MTVCQLFDNRVSTNDDGTYNVKDSEGNDSKSFSETLKRVEKLVEIHGEKGLASHMQSISPTDIEVAKALVKKDLVSADDLKNLTPNDWAIVLWTTTTFQNEAGKDLSVFLEEEEETTAFNSVPRIKGASARIQAMAAKAGVVVSNIRGGDSTKYDEEEHKRNYDKKALSMDKQLEKANGAQRRVLERLIHLHAFKRDVNDSSYELITGEEVNRISNVLSREQKFSFNNKDREDDFELNAQWGNQLDDIMSYILETGDESFLGIKKALLQGVKDREENLLMSDNVIKQIINIALEVQGRYPGAVFMTQAFIFNEEVGIGGTADIVLVDANGRIRVLDIKSSINPIAWNGSFFETIQHKKEYIGGKIVNTNFTHAYDKGFTVKGVPKGSRKEKHEAQGSLYIGMYKAHLLDIARDNPFNVIGLHITNIDPDTDALLDVELEFHDYPEGKGIQLDDKYVKLAQKKEKHVSLDLSPYADKTSNVIEKLKISIRDTIRHSEDHKVPGSKFMNISLRRYLRSLDEINELETIENYIAIMYKYFVDNGNFNNQLDNLKDDIRKGKFEDDMPEGS